MQSNPIHINKWLLPLSWLYGLIVFIRNKLFECNILKQKKYDIPIICIGNITVGGTGKTPHTEYLIELLSPHYRVAVLSRGYKRKSKGFILATETSSSYQIGDEPFQIKNKYPHITVAVDTKRTRGIENLLSLPEEIRPQVILLDDAFQHRYVKSSFTILLTDYNRLMVHDKLLPAGRLREPAHYAECANIIIVTKCPKGLNPLDQRITSKDIHPYPYQSLLYTGLSYGKLRPVFGDGEGLTLNKIYEKELLVVTGIANPRPFYKRIKRYSETFDLLEYPDHYQFSKKDIAEIKRRLDKLSESNRMIIVTEKDAARFRSMEIIPDEIKAAMYYLPIKIAFVNKEDQEIFNQKIINHVKENTRNSRLYKR